MKTSNSNSNSNNEVKITKESLISGFESNYSKFKSYEDVVAKIRAFKDQEKTALDRAFEAGEAILKFKGEAITKAKTDKKDERSEKTISGDCNKALMAVTGLSVRYIQKLAKISEPENKKVIEIELNSDKYLLKVKTIAGVEFPAPKYMTLNEAYALVSDVKTESEDYKTIRSYVDSFYVLYGILNDKEKTTLLNRIQKLFVDLDDRDVKRIEDYNRERAKRAKE